MPILIVLLVLLAVIVICVVMRKKDGKRKPEKFDPTYEETPDTEMTPSKDIQMGRM